MSVYPDKGPSGSSSTLHLWNFLPDQKVSAIFRVIGDPVVATGTTDAQGQAYLNFTVPQAPDGVYWILASQDNRACVHASVHFQIGTVPPTPTPTAPPPPTVAPTAPPPVVTPAPKPPVAGSGPGSSTAVMDFTIAAAGCWLAAAGFAVLMASRRRNSRTR